MDNKYLKSIRYCLDNHQKLISMISEKSLPIKKMLLKDVFEMKSIIETALSNKGESK